MARSIIDKINNELDDIERETNIVDDNIENIRDYLNELESELDDIERCMGRIK